jgi:hypothetical protein
MGLKLPQEWLTDGSSVESNIWWPFVPTPLADPGEPWIYDAVNDEWSGSAVLGDWTNRPVGFTPVEFRDLFFSGYTFGFSTASDPGTPWMEVPMGPVGNFFLWCRGGGEAFVEIGDFIGPVWPTRTDPTPFSTTPVRWRYGSHPDDDDLISFEDWLDADSARVRSHFWRGGLINQDTAGYTNRVFGYSEGAGLTLQRSGDVLVWDGKFWPYLIAYTNFPSQRLSSQAGQFQESLGSLTPTFYTVFGREIKIGATYNNSETPQLLATMPIKRFNRAGRI